MGEAGMVEQPVETPGAQSAQPVETIQNNQPSRETQSDPGTESDTGKTKDGEKAAEQQDTRPDERNKGNQDQPAEESSSQTGYMSPDGLWIADSSWKGGTYAQANDDTKSLEDVQPGQFQSLILEQTGQISGSQEGKASGTDAQPAQLEMNSPQDGGSIEETAQKDRDLTSSFDDSDLKKNKVMRQASPVKTDIVKKQGDEPTTMAKNPEMLDLADQSIEARSPGDGPSLSEGLERSINENNEEISEVKNASLIEGVSNLVEAQDSDSHEARDAQAIVDALQRKKGERGERQDKPSRKELQKGERLIEVIRQRKSREEQDKSQDKSRGKTQKRAGERTFRFRWDVQSRTEQTKGENIAQADFSLMRNRISSEKKDEQPQNMGLEQIKDVDPIKQNHTKISKENSEQTEDRLAKEPVERITAQKEGFKSQTDDDHAQSSRFEGTTLLQPTPGKIEKIGRGLSEASNIDKTELGVEQPEAVRGFQSFKQEWKQRRHYIFIADLGRDQAYEKGATSKLKMQYPDHEIVRVKSFQDIQERLAKDQKAIPGKIGDLIIVAHGNEYGVLKLPMTDADANQSTPKKVINPLSSWSLANIAKAINQGKADAFQRDREQALAGVDSKTKIMIEACNFGLSKDGLEMVHSYFGGDATVYGRPGLAQFGYQPIGQGEAPIYTSLEQTYDSLAAQDQLAEGTKALSPKEKRAVVQKILDENNGLIPDQSLVLWNNIEKFRSLPKSEQRDPTSQAAEQLKLRPGMSRPVSYEKAYADSLSNRGLIEQAKSLRQIYQPEYEQLLTAMRESWEDRFEGKDGRLGVPADLQAEAGDLNDPLYGLAPSSVFGEKEVDAQTKPNVNGYWIRFDQAWADSAKTGPDPFLSASLKTGGVMSIAERRQAETEFNEGLLNNLATASLLEQPYSSRGIAENLESGGIRLWNFAVGQSELRKEFIQPLQQFVERAGSDPNTKILIEGFASSSGSVSRNLEISKNRTEEVKQFFIKTGLPEEQILQIGHGEAQSSNNADTNGHVDPEIAARNRRVDISLISQTIPPASTNIIKEAETALTGQIEDLTKEIPNRFGDVMNAIGLANDTISHITEILDITNKYAFATQALLGPVLAFLDFYSYARSIQINKEAWHRDSELLGIRLGFEAARILAAENQLGRKITADDMGRALNLELAYKDPEHQKALEYVTKENIKEFIELYRIGPFSVDPKLKTNFNERIRRGLEKDAKLINDVVSMVDTDFRQRLINSGRLPEAVERDFNANIRQVRLHAVEILEKWSRQEFKKIR